jgi:hypothetical protein
MRLSQGRYYYRCSVFAVPACCIGVLVLWRSVFRVHSEHDKADEVNDGSCSTPRIVIALKVEIQRMYSEMTFPTQS